MSSTIIKKRAIEKNSVVSQASCRMDGTRIEQRAYIKINSGFVLIFFTADSLMCVVVYVISDK